MKIYNLTNGLVAALLLASPIVGAETEYPASDFKPKVIYQDTSSQTKSAPATVSAKQEKAADVDSKYPASDFEPKVLYKDANYKPSKFTGASSSSEASSSVSEQAIASDSEASAPVKAKEDSSMVNYLLGLVVFAVVGYIFFGKRESKPSVSESPVYTRHVSGLSGVSRYLRKNNMVAATGVAKYLESRGASEKPKAAVSSVEKYLEKQASSAKEKAAQARTGVEKYVRNRG